MKRYPSKRDILIGVLIWVPMLGATGMGLVDKPWVALALLPALGLCGWMWFGTSYTITEETLETRCGPFRESVRLKEIRKVAASRSLMSGAALSLDRISITHGRFGGETLISPRERREFLLELSARCPDAAFDEKLRTEIAAGAHA